MKKTAIKIGLTLILFHFFFIPTETESLLAASFTADMVAINHGESKTRHVARDQKIGSVGITMLESGIRARVEQPGKPGIIPPSRCEAAAAVLVAANSQTSAAPQKSSEADAPSATGPAVKNGDTARMVLVLDASGSMWGQIDGKAKIEIAKEVVAELIDQIPAGFQTGLTVYGHRRKGDCKDIEMVIPVGPHNAAAMKAKVKGISPKGKTPLSESVRQAAQALRYTEERATVILVSDGLETCDIDPCALAAELAMSGVEFTVHVIGFDISKEDQGRLRCMADKTGGLFLAASNAGSLRDALFKTVEEVKAPPPPVVEDPGTAVLEGPASVPAGSAFSVQWEGPDSRGDYIAIAEKGSKDLNYRDYRYTKKGNPADFTAPGKVGEYELRYIHAYSRKVIGRAGLEVTPVQATVQAPATADVAVQFEVKWQGPDYPSDYVAIARPDQRTGSQVHYTYTKKGSPLKLGAPSDPGTYEVRYIMGRGSHLLAKTTIEIEAVSASVEAPAAADVATKFEVTWQGPDNKSDYIAIARPDQDPGRQVHYTYTKKGSPLKLRAPSDPGTYEVRYILGQGSKLLAKTTIEIEAVSAKVEAPAAADVAAQFEVTWQGPDNKSDYIAIARSDQEPGRQVNYTYTSKGSPLKLRAPSDPGTYEVRYILGQGSKLLAKTTIEIEAVSAAVEAPAAADVASQFEVTWQGPDNKSDYIAIARSDQDPGRQVHYTYTKKGSPLKLRAPSDPGTYEVRYILGQGSKLLAKTTIEIEAVSAAVEAPAAADVASQFEVTWQGPDNKSDYIAIARSDQDPGRQVNYTYTSKGSPLKLRAPSDPGTYEVRYILGQGSKLLAKTKIEIEAVSAKVQAPASATVNTEFEVTWQGPDYKSDYISIARPDQGPGRYVTYTYTSRGNPLKIKAPNVPGTYEVRYILGQGSKVLDKATITIK